MAGAPLLALRLRQWNPQVEAALGHELTLVPLVRLILIKFVGGVLAIGSGLALGPEGPSVQIQINLSIPTINFLLGISRNFRASSS